MADGNGAAEGNVGTTKRMRRPSVRLQLPCDEKPGNCMSRKQLQQREPIKKDAGVKKTRQVKTTVGKSRKNSIVNYCSNEDDDVVIGSWKSFGIVNRERNLTSKARKRRIKPSGTSRWVSLKSDENKDESKEFQLSSGGESEKQEGDEEENNSEEDEIHRKFAHENSDPASFDDDGNNRVRDNCEDGRRRLQVVGDSNEMERVAGRGELDRDRDGVKVWLNQLGLVKYAMLFEVHEVDDEILPLLTLEDLKEMGINAVGSRRKMYSSIQKLSKEFS